MATVSFADLAASFSAADIAALASFDLASSTEFSWETTAGDHVELSGTGFTYNAGQFTGTVTQMTVDIGNDGGDPDLVISGLSFSLSTLMPALSNLGAAAAQELLWRTLLGGDDTVDFGSSGNSVSFNGDGFTVSADEVISAGDDVLSGDIGASTDLSGDFSNVAQGGVLHGGDDTVNVAMTDDGRVFGDAQTVSGTLLGGDDVLTLGGATGSRRGYGDALEVGAGGIVIGGDDTVTLGGSLASDYVAVGDVASVYGTLYGGDDTIAVDEDYTGGVTVYADAVEARDGCFIKGGDDTVIGGAGSDNLVGDVNSIVEGSTVKGGDDVIYGNGGDDVIRGDWSNDVSADTTLTGGNDQLYGGGGSDYLFGNGGDDLLDGGADADYLTGGAGDDTYVVDNANDMLSENTGEGADLVLSSVDWTLASNFEDLTLTGDDDISGTGNSSANTISGNGGNNTLDGAGGIDTLAGGYGDDTYIVDSADDLVKEGARHGSADVVEAKVSYVLDAEAYVEILRARDAAATTALNLTGNDLGQSITGNAGVNILIGGDGEDRLDGLGGADSLTGGDGDDTYVVDDAGDQLQEQSGEGTDLAISSISWTLGENFENLTLTGGQALSATGNSGANILTGNDAANTLNGLAGLDTLVGGAGKDIFVFDAALIAGNVDTVDDFSRVDDTFHIDNAVFAGLKAGNLSKKDFTLVSSANSTKGVDASDHILYDKADGDLYFDRDGSGKKFDRVLFAHVDDGTQLTNADFFIV